MIVRKTQGAGISGAVRYVTGQGKRDPVAGIVPGLAPGTASRVAWVSGTGFGFAVDRPSRVETARRVMEWMAQTQTSKTRKCKDDCLHLMLSWPEGEQPGRATMEAAARSLLGTLGMGQARAIFAAHADTDHVHMHIVASRIDPQTGKAFSSSYDTAVMSKWALNFEKRSGGVRCEGRIRKSPAANSQAAPQMRGWGQTGYSAEVSSTRRYRTNNYQSNIKQTYANVTSRDPAPSLKAPVDKEVQAERDMISEAARPYREQITQEGALTMNGMPWWLPIAIIFAVYITIQLWHLYQAQHGDSTPDQRSL